jgi:hypothetical protein
MNANLDFSWRLDLARDIAKHYASRPGVAFIILGGSASRGPTDPWSDLDILVYWDTPDPAWLETPPLEAAGARRFTWRVTFPDDVWLEQYFIGAQKIDVAHASAAWWERIVGDVVDRADPEDWKQGTVGGFFESIPLHGAEAFEPWRRRIANYPDALAKHMIETHLHIYPLWVIEKQGLARGDLYAFHDILIETIRHLMGVLAGLNRVYFATEKLKRIGATAEAMAIRPRDAGARFNALFTLPRAEVPAALGALITDVFDLVDTLRPDVDTARARRRFAMTLEDCMERPEFHAPD